MKKFECKGCDTHCELTLRNYWITPKDCPYGDDNAKWEEVKEEHKK